MSKTPKISDHFDGQRFFNPGGTVLKTFKDILRWKREGGRSEWPKWVENSGRPELPASVAAGEVHVTFVNHITFLLQYTNFNVLTDPVFSKRASPSQLFGPARVRAPGIALKALPRIDVILLSHNHYDHLDSGALRELARLHDPLVITPLGNAHLLRPFKNVIELDWWEQHVCPNGEKITLVPAQHWSARGLRDRNLALWGGFFVEASATKTYFAGDTGYCDHFKEIRKRLGAPDVSLLPIGAYEPRWFMQDQHMNPADSVQVHIELESKFSIGSHYQCFQLTDEAIDQPVKDLAAALKERKVDASEFRAPETGETIVYRRK